MISRPTFWLLVCLCTAGARPSAGQPDPRHPEYEAVRYGLPATPRPIDRLPLRGGLELHVGWRDGDDALSRVVLGYAAFMEHATSDDWSLGLRLSYLGADAQKSDEPDAPSQSSLTPAATVAWMPRTPTSQHGFRFGLRTGIGYRFTNGNNHAVVSATALVALARLGVGVRYQRALEADSASRDAVFLVTERTTPTFTRSTRKSKMLRVGLGLHALSGWSLGDDLGPMPIGLRVDLPFTWSDKKVLPTVSYEVLWFPAVDAPSVVVQTMSAGLWWVQHRRARWLVSPSVGYGLAQGDRPRTIGSGLLGSLSGYWLLNSPGLFLGVNLRSGLLPSNRRMQALFLSVGGVQIFR